MEIKEFPKLDTVIKILENAAGVQDFTFRPLTMTLVDLLKEHRKEVLCFLNKLLREQEIGKKEKNNG